MISLFCAIACGLANIAVGCSIKGAQQTECKFSVFFSIATGLALLLSLFAFPIFHGASAGWGTWGIGIALGGFFWMTTLLGIIANLMGPPSMAWSTANMGLMIPIALSAIFFGEALRYSDIFMLLSFILMLIFFQSGMAKAKDVPKSPFLYALLLLMVFIFNGLFMFAFKLNQNFYPAANKACLLIAMYESSFVLSFSVTVANWLRTGRKNIKVRSIAMEMKWGAMLGMSIGVTMVFMQGAVSLPAIVLFPLVQGLSLLGGVVGMSYIFREIFNWQKAVGVALGLIIIVLCVLR